jgi:hypothetical protein
VRLLEIEQLIDRGEAPYGRCRLSEKKAKAEPDANPSDSEKLEQHDNVLSEAGN